MNPYIATVCIIIILVGLCFYVYFSMLVLTVSPKIYQNRDEKKREIYRLLLTTPDIPQKTITKILLLIRGDHNIKFNTKGYKYYEHIEDLIKSKKSIVIEKNRIRSMYVYENENEYYILFTGTKRIHSFVKEFFKRRMVTVPHNGIRLLTKFADVYCKYYYPQFQRMMPSFDTNKPIHVLGYSMGGVMAHLFCNDFRHHNIASLDTIGTPPIFSKYSQWVYKGHQTNYMMHADIITNFFEPIIENEPLMIPGRIRSINENYGSYILNHDILNYFHGVVSFIAELISDTDESHIYKANTVTHDDDTL